MDAFHFALTGEEKDYLKNCVKLRIAARLAGKAAAVPQPPTDKLREAYGAFVTLNLRGRLRGCIGHIIGDRPLFTTIADMAEAAAFEDPRFPPLSPEEFEAVTVEISVLSPLTPCPDPNLVEVGRHGLLMRRGGRSGLLLPQVPVEWGWDRETFLCQTCSKAGMEPGCWKDPATQIFWFEAEVF
ncbi:AMMECR1 domain protein [Solidesulfovibrio fructosivorans JJ]]|uniref:AMMECR1 domain protein n=1 Tax=Solidesulfovibrio fructosivorans JJ] TaxID=596151 RepID=E1JV01_SOLFR|nr:AmmeMemoRadiSam system protein A [Solidesulfovibrio fructosivorans]EFL51915.1 AMMECR1 domain protein [Solidesulfovibrio fructosivorans JJ]]